MKRSQKQKILQAFADGYGIAFIGSMALYLIYRKEDNMKVKALIETYSGGKYGRPGKYIAIVEPQFFKNGNMKKTGFTVIEKIETIKKGYHHQCANYSERIAEILEEME